MKKLLIALLVIIPVVIFAQNKVDNLITFDKENHSFGKVEQNIAVTAEFTFTNTGKTPIIIESASAECGCTTPEYPKAPVMAGKKGKIKVTYDSKTAGSFTKRVTVKLVNIPDSKILTITGDVIAQKS